MMMMMMILRPRHLLIISGVTEFMPPKIFGPSDVCITLDLDCNDWIMRCVKPVCKHRPFWKSALCRSTNMLIWLSSSARSYVSLSRYRVSIINSSDESPIIAACTARSSSSSFKNCSAALLSALPCLPRLMICAAPSKASYAKVRRLCARCFSM